MTIDDIPEYVEVKAGDLVRAQDWNQIQRQTRSAIRSHRHKGKTPDTDSSTDNAPQIDKGEIAAGAVEESNLDATLKQKLVTGGNSHDHSSGNGAKIKHSFLELDTPNPHKITATMIDKDTQGNVDLIVKQINQGSGVIDAKHLAPTQVTLSLAPSFFPNGSTAPWKIKYGVAFKDASLTEKVDGWLPLSLPPYSNITSMSVVARKSQNVALAVALARRAVDSESLTELLSFQTSDFSAQPNNTIFTIPKDISANNLVETDKYIYLVSASLSATAATVELFTIKLVCSYL